MAGRSRGRGAAGAVSASGTARVPAAGDGFASGAAGASAAGDAPAAPGPAGASPARGVSSYYTLRAGAEATAEFVDRKSRFIAQLVHVEDEGQATEFVAAVRARHYDARHNVPAWVLADGRERASDDGEPQRTSGMPTLEALRGAGLADVCCVVTRYFGGVLLGPGGLVRAYSTATQRAAEAARSEGLVVEMTLVRPVTARVPYALLDRVRDLAARTGAHERSCDYAADVTLSLVFREGEQDTFVGAMRELANGAELCEVGEPAFAEF